MRESITDIYTYMCSWSEQLGQRILQEYPALHQVEDAVSPRIAGLLRQPFPAQSIAIIGVAKRWQEARTAEVIAECGTGKTLTSLGAIHVHSAGRLFTALAMVPPHLVEKWAREAFLTIPGVRAFLIDGMRNGGDEKTSHGVNEVRLKRVAVVREGLHFLLGDLRLRKQKANARELWHALCMQPALFIVGRERAKLGYFWRHAYDIARSGPYAGWLVNPDTGRPTATKSTAWLRLNSSDATCAAGSIMPSVMKFISSQAIQRKATLSVLWHRAAGGSLV